MGIYFEHSAEHNFMLIILHGPVSNDEVNTHIKRLLSGEYDTPGMRGLMVICENISKGQLGWRTIFDSGKRMQNAKFRQNSRLAIVTGSTLTYGFARIYQAATESKDAGETRVLRKEEMAEALRWLDVESLSLHILSAVQRCQK